MTRTDVLFECVGTRLVFLVGVFAGAVAYTLGWGFFAGFIVALVLHTATACVKLVKALKAFDGE